MKLLLSVVVIPDDQKMVSSVCSLTTDKPSTIMTEFHEMKGEAEALSIIKDVLDSAKKVGY